MHEGCAPLVYKLPYFVQPVVPSGGSNDQGNTDIGGSINIVEHRCWYGEIDRRLDRGKGLAGDPSTVRVILDIEAHANIMPLGNRQSFDLSAHVPVAE